MPARLTRAYDSLLAIAAVGVAIVGLEGLALGDQEGASLPHDSEIELQRPIERVALPGSARLPAGVNLIVARDRRQPVVAVVAYWSWPGGRAGGDGASGPTREALLAATQTRGCGRRGGAAAEAEVEALAGSMRATASADGLAVRAAWPARAWRDGLALALDCAVEPQLSGRAAVAAAAAWRRRRADARAQPAALAEHALVGHLVDAGPPAEAAGPGEPSGAGLRALHRQVLASGAMTLAIVGDVEPARVRAAVRAWLAAGGGAGRGARSSAGARPAGPATVAASSSGGAAAGGAAAGGEAPAPAEFHIAHPAPERGDGYLAVGFPAVRWSAPEQVALELWIERLSGPSGGLLGGVLAPEGIYDVRGELVTTAAGGYVRLLVHSPAARLDRVYQRLSALFSRLADSAPRAGALSALKARLIARYRDALAQPAVAASALAYRAAHGPAGRPPGAPLATSVAALVKDREAQIRAVNVAAMQAAASRYLKWSHALTVTVAPALMSPAAAARTRGVDRRLPKRVLRQRRDAAGGRR